MTTPGKLWASADGAHPGCEQVFFGQSCWSTLSADPARGSAGLGLEVLLLSVPPDLHEFQGVVLAECSARLSAWKESALGLVKLRTSSQVVLAVLDVAGRRDLARLERAARGSGVYAMTVAAGQRATPVLRIHGFRDMLSEAAGLRRLTAKEFTAAIADLRAELRETRDHWCLRSAAEQVKTLTINVTQPL